MINNLDSFSSLIWLNPLPQKKKNPATIKNKGFRRLKYLYLFLSKFNQFCLIVIYKS